MALNVLGRVRDTVTQRLSRRVTPPDKVLRRYKKMISNVLSKKGVDADKFYNDQRMTWIVPLQPVPVFIRLVRRERQDGKTDDFIEVFARMMQLPSEPLVAVYRFLLGFNMTLVGTAFAVDSGYIYLCSQRPLEGLDENELEDMVGAVIAVVNQALPLLQQEFAVGAVPL